MCVAICKIGLQISFGELLKYKTINNILYASERFFKRIAYAFILYILALAFIYPLVVDSVYDKIYVFSLVIIISISIFAEYFFGMTYSLYLQAEQKKYVISIIHIYPTK